MAETRDGELARELGLADAVAIFVGIILGSGIFVAPSAVAAVAPTAPGAVGLWLLGGVVAACGGFCYAECGARLPRAGGFFVFYREAFGEAVAFVAGWTAVLVTYPASNAAVALVFADYAGKLWPMGSGGRLAIAVAGVAAAGLLNVFGVRLGALAQRLLTSGKVVALLLLCVAAVASGHVPAVAGPAAVQGASAPSAAWLLAAMVLLWTYEGWSDVTLAAGEVRDPGRNLGRTVVVGLGVLTVAYSAVQFAVMHLLSAPVAASSGAVFSDAVTAGLGPRAGGLVAGLVVVSTLGSINAIVLTSSRIGFAMARAGVFPGWFGAVHPRFRTPARSVLGLTAASIFYVCAGGFGDLVSLFSFAVWVFYALTAVALLRLRRSGVGEPLVWRAPLGIVPPVVILTTAAVMTSALFQASPLRSAAGLGIILLGFPAYYGWRKLSRRGAR